MSASAQSDAASEKPATVNSTDRKVVLKIESLNVYYGGIHALKGIDLDVREGELVTLIGCNGAGKTTTLNAIAGLQPPREGKVTFYGDDITGEQAHLLVRRGLALCPEGRRIFPNLTVDENIDLGAFIRNDRAEIRKDHAKMQSIFPRLAERARQMAGTLSGGEQQMLAIARAMMSRPRLLMLDEPSLGLAPKLVEQIFNVLKDLKARGVTILLVEQNARQALHVADRAYVLETGKMVKTGPARELADDPAVCAAYLGG